MQRLTNPVKERLDKGELAIGMGVRGLRGVEVARLMKSAGFDWLFIDLEHGSTSVETASQISVAALDADIAPLVRVPAGELALGARCLDGGRWASSFRMSTRRSRRARLLMRSAFHRWDIARSGALIRISVSLRARLTRWSAASTMRRWWSR